MATMRRRFFGVVYDSLIFTCLRIANRSLNNLILTSFIVLAIFVKEMTEIAEMIPEKIHFISIEGVSEHISSKAFSSQRLSSCYEVSVLNHDRLAISFCLCQFRPDFSTSISY
jgi:hypothetical protein